VSANIDSAGNVRQLDLRAEPDAAPTEEQVSNAPKLVRLLAKLIKDVATLRRRFAPRRIDFEGVAVNDNGTIGYRFPHHFGSMVRWWPVSWQSAAGGAAVALDQASDSDNDTLVLVSYAAGTITLRVEEAG
jgi:hypothetical protein